MNSEHPFHDNNLEQVIDRNPEGSDTVDDYTWMLHGKDFGKKTASPFETDMETRVVCRVFQLPKIKGKP